MGVPLGTTLTRTATAAQRNECACAPTVALGNVTTGEVSP